VRALTAAYVRNVTTPDIRKTLRDYISVQVRQDIHQRRRH
jgi:hypothetical protein